MPRHFFQNVQLILEVAPDRPLTYGASAVQVGGHLFTLKMKRVVRQSGLSTSRFPDFDDKERVSRLYDDLDDYIAQTAWQLSDEDRVAIQRVERYRFEMPDLDALIKSKAGLKRRLIISKCNASGLRR